MNRKGLPLGFLLLVVVSNSPIQNLEHETQYLQILDNLRTILHNENGSLIFEVGNVIYEVGSIFLRMEAFIWRMEAIILKCTYLECTYKVLEDT